jgi:branched-chain amino acid transport system substrate-binding protein
MHRVISPRWALVAVLALALGACGSDNNGGATKTSKGGGSSPKDGVTATKIVIGGITDLTGPTAVSSTPFVHGVQSYFNAVNKGGGVNGRTIDFVSLDDKYEVPTVVTQFRKFLTQTPALATIGIHESAAQASIYKTVAAGNMPVMPFTTLDNVAAEKPKNFFFLTPNNTTQANLLVQYMANKLNKGSDLKGAALVVNNPAGLVVAQAVEDEVKRLGGTFTGKQEVEVTLTSLDTQVRELAAKQPDFIVMYGSPTTAVIVMKAIQKFNLDIPVLGMQVSGAIDVYQTLDERTSKLFEFGAAYAVSDVETAGTKQMVADATASGFQAETNAEYFVNGYTTARVLVDAITRAGDTPTRASLTKALNETQSFENDGLSPAVSYGADQNIGITEQMVVGYDSASKKLIQANPFTGLQT